MYMQCSAVSKAAKPTLHAASLVADRHVMFWFARWRLLSACVVYNTHQNGNSENRRREFQHRQDAFSVKIQNIHMSIRIQVADHFGGPGTADGRCLTCFCSCVVYLFANRLLSRRAKLSFQRDIVYFCSKQHYYRTVRKCGIEELRRTVHFWCCNQEEKTDMNIYYVSVVNRGVRGSEILSANMPRRQCTQC